MGSVKHALRVILFRVIEFLATCLHIFVIFLKIEAVSGFKLIKLNKDGNRVAC
jgi:hypothetical protein